MLGIRPTTLGSGLTSADPNPGMLDHRFSFFWGRLFDAYDDAAVLEVLELLKDEPVVLGDW